MGGRDWEERPGDDENDNMKSDTQRMVEYWKGRVVKDEQMSSCEQAISKDPYHVDTWITYMDLLEEQIAERETNETSTSTAAATSKKRKTAGKGGADADTDTPSSLRYAREFVGRRACRLLPRSYKLWKRQWEYMLGWEKYVVSQLTTLPTKLSEEPDDTTTVAPRTATDPSLLLLAERYEGALDRLTVRIRAMFERGLWTLHAMPRIWTVYLEWIYNTLTRDVSPRTHLIFHNDDDGNRDDPTATGQREVGIGTHIRRLIDRCLRSVPATQHLAKVWPTVLRIVNSAREPPPLPAQSRIRILRRYCAADPAYLTQYAQILIDPCRQYGAAAQVYYELLLSSSSSTTAIVSTSGGTGEEEEGVDANGSGVVDANDVDDLWSSFVTLCSQHPVEVERMGIPWERMVRTVLRVETEEQTASGTNHPKATGNIRPNHPNPNQKVLHGFLWSQLADAYIRQGLFDLARSVYEEGMQSVSTVRDFTVLFQAYLNLEESLLQQAAIDAEEGDDDDDGEDQGAGQDADAGRDPDDWDLLLSTCPTAGGEATAESRRGGGRARNKLAEMEWCLARAEHLTSRRPFLINAVLLRQNPNNVAEWLTRSKLFQELDNNTSSGSSSSASGGAGAGATNRSPVDAARGCTSAAASSTTGSMSATNTLSTSTRQAAQVLEQALKTVVATKAINGTVADLVVQLVSVYDSDSAGNSGSGGTALARDVLDRVCQQNKYRLGTIDQLVECWICWIEFELKHEQYDDALSLARQAVAPKPPGTTGPNKHLNITRSLRLWDLLLDLEESLGTVQTTKDAYNQALERQVATVQHVLNFAAFLIERKYFEEAFAAYEKGLGMFAFPHNNDGAKILWKEYIQAFVARYKGTKIERVRDLFDRCLQHCPSELCSEFYIMWGAYEEEYGLTMKRTLEVYKRMCDAVPAGKEKLTAYKLWIAKTIKYMGMTATRDIYEQAINQIEKDDASVALLCIDFATMEADQLHQVDRARAVYAYGAQMADPRRLPEYWKAFHEFEIAYGNEETFREMLRVKRSVEAAFSTVNYNASGMAPAASGGKSQERLTEEEAIAMIASQEGIAIDDPPSTTAVAGFVASKSSSDSAGSNKRTSQAANLDDVEERVAKLRKATGAAAAVAAADENHGGSDDDNDDDEIDIDDIDAEIEQAAAEGAAAAASEPEVVEEQEAREDAGKAGKAKDDSTTGIKDVATKAVPAAVFGGLVKEQKKS